MPKLGSRYKKAIVTGASSGLGKAFAQMLSGEGVAVWGTSRAAKDIEGIQTVSLDLNNKQSVKDFIQWMQDEMADVDLLINNAGSGAFYAFEDFPPENIEQQLQLLLTAPIQLTRAVYPLMLKRGRGTIVNVSSLAADFPLPYMPLYNAAKAGLSRFTRSLDMDGGNGVTLIDFMPGDFHTRFNDTAEKSLQSDRADLQKAWTALGDHLSKAPSPNLAAADLKRALLRGKSGVVTTGSPFQSKVAPFLQRFSCWRLTRATIRRYYGLQK